jgi:hypothetical protein
LQQWLAEPLGEKDIPRHGLGPTVPIAECLCVLGGEPRNIGNRFLKIAAEDQCASVHQRHRKLVVRRHVGDTIAQLQVAKPRSVGNVEMIDRMEIVIETGLGDLERREPAAIL